jgi:flavin-dependent dehydrogenase
MKVAIMGAGLSGLCCAIILEKNGISPVIFEKRSMPGDRFINAEALFNISNRPINNCLDYFRDEYGIDLKPIDEINKITVYGPNSEAFLQGNLGYSNIRGRHERSFESQLAKQVKSKITFNSKYEYEDLLKEYTHIVLATGDAAYATKLNNFRADLSINVKGATVDGEFKTNHVISWYNNEFAPKGYAYLMPYTEKEANISIAYPSYSDTTIEEIDDLWEKFYARAKKDINQSLNITDKYEVERYILGTCYKPKINNTYFTGNCFGSIMPAYGLGQFVAILTGIYAAHDICRKGNYEELVEPLKKSYKNSFILRKAMEKLDNNKLDLFVKAMDNGIAGKMFGNETEFDFFSAAGKILKPFIKEINN